MPSSTSENSWEGVARLAKEAGARFPDLVAAQWALESGWGRQAPGNNYFGLKATKGEGIELDTTEFVDGKEQAQKDYFLEFDSLKDCVQYLVDKWYKDYKGYKGVNHSASAASAARKLQKEGYATNPAYATKLIELMQAHAKEAEPKPTPVAAEKPAVVEKPLFAIKALKDTLLKKRPNPSDELDADEKHVVPAGQTYPVLQIKELARDSHFWVELGFDAGEWFIYMPHWQYSGSSQSVAPAKLNWDDFNSLVTPHLTVGEVLQWDARRKPKPHSAVEARILHTAQEFEAVRKAYGSALGVTSFYRPEPINQQVGGVPGSLHTLGKAVDLYPVNGSLNHFYQWIRARWTGGLGDGRNRGFVHLDTQSGGRFVPGAGVRPIREWDY